MAGLSVIGNIYNDEDEREYELNKQDEYARKARLGSLLKNLQYKLKYAGVHTWAGGVAATDSIDLSAVSGLVVETDDLIVVNALDSAAALNVEGVRNSNTQIDLTTHANAANGERFQYLIYSVTKDQS
jgi:hypothetical protein